MNTEESLSASQEDYLEMIVRLIRSKGAARVRDIADRLSVAKSSVSIALRALSKRDLVHYKPYELVTLTEKGEAMADRILERHRFLSSFLSSTLAMDADEAEANACRMEHAAGEEVIERLRAFVALMENGDMPARALPGAFREQWGGRRRRRRGRGAAGAVADPLGAASGWTLADVAPGERARVLRTGGEAADRLIEMGVTRGAWVKVIRTAPLGDPIEVDVRGYRLSLRKADARAIAVEPEGAGGQ